MNSDIPSSIGLIGLIIVCLLSALSGWWALRRGVPTAHDYYAAGGNMGGLILSLSIMAAIFSMAIFFGLSSLAYRTGLAAIAAVGAAGGTIGFFWYSVHKKTFLLAKAKKWMSMGAVYECRYGPGMRGFVAWMIFLTSISYLAAQIQAVGLVFKALNLPYWGGMVFVLIFVVFYMALGGFRGTTYAHVVQTLIFLAIALVIVVAVFAEIGLGNITRQLLAANKAPLLQIGGAGGKIWGYPMLLAYGLVAPLAVVCQPMVYQHIFATRSFSGFKIWTWSFGAVSLFLGIFSVLVGLAGAVLFPNLKGMEVEGVYVLVTGKLFVPWLAALLIGGVVGAGMSTIDGLVMGNTMNLVNDWYRISINPNASQKQLITYGRFGVVLLVIIAALIVSIPVIPVAELAVLGMAGPAMFGFAVLGGNVWRKATKAGAISSILVGVILLYFMSFVWPRTLLNPIPWLGGLNSFLVSFFIAGIVFFVVSLFTKDAAGVGDEFFHPALDQR